MSAEQSGAPEKRAEPSRKDAVGVWKLIWRFLKRVRPYLGLLFLTVIVISVSSGARAFQVALVKPLLDRRSDPGAEAEESEFKVWVYERIGNPNEWDLMTIGGLAIVAATLMFVFGFLRDYLTNFLTQRMVADVRNDVANHLAHLPLQSHYDRRSGDLVARVGNDVTVMQPAASFLFDDALVHPITIVWMVGLMLFIDPLLTGIALIGFPIYVVPLVWLGRRLRKYRKKSLVQFGEMTGTLVQMFGGIKTIKAFNREENEVAAFRGHNEKYFRRFLSAVRQKALGENMAQLFVGFAIAAVIVGGGWLLERGELTAGDMTVLGLGIAVVNSSVRVLTKAYNQLVTASTGAERVFELLDQPREAGHDKGADLDKIGGVEYRGVHFAYDGAPVLRDIDLQVGPGQVVAIVGKTGSGKTTLLDLLCRFYDPQQGEIRVNGQRLDGFKRSSLLSHIAVVTQDTFLFHATIGENIRYGRPEATREQVEAAARAAHIHDFIASLENGYDTVVGERGAKLSGGQRQRVAIARAMLKDPSILILDEATSALDAESEQAVQAGMEKMMESRDRITLVIAHRLSTVRKADRIVVLEEGRIVEQGTHDELVEKEGVYAGLYRNQFVE